MTKISFDVDFSQDPEKILQEIQKRAEAEVAKREAKDKEKNYLSKLHEVVNQEIGTDYKNINSLIRALTKYASPSVRDKIENTTPSGRRKTISMNKEIYDEIQTLLAKPNPNKAAIARETGVSVVQVRKVAEGGYDSKFGGVVSVGKVPPMPKSEPAKDELPAPSLPPIDDGSLEETPSLAPLPPVAEEDSKSDDLPPTLPPVEESSDTGEEDNMPEAPSLDLPAPTFGDDSPAEEANDLPAVPSPLEDSTEPSIGLPPAPSFGEEEESNELPAPPSPLGDIPTPPTDLPPLHLAMMPHLLLNLRLLKMSVMNYPRHQLHLKKHLLRAIYLHHHLLMIQMTQQATFLLRHRQSKLRAFRKKCLLPLCPNLLLKRIYQLLLLLHLYQKIYLQHHQYLLPQWMHLHQQPLLLPQAHPSQACLANQPFR